MTRKVYTTFILSASITRGVTYAKLTHTVAEGRYTTAPYLFPAGCVAHTQSGSGEGYILRKEGLVGFSL